MYQNQILNYMDPTTSLFKTNRRFITKQYLCKLLLSDLITIHINPWTGLVLKVQTMLTKTKTEQSQVKSHFIFSNLITKPFPRHLFICFSCFLLFLEENSLLVLDRVL